ncbi:MAG: hypothetical protein V4478_03240 [Patescibacteria group bacterium]
MKKLHWMCERFHSTDLAGAPCPKCANFKCGKSYSEKLREQVDAIPREMKQALLDNVWSGMKLGEAAVKAGFKEDDTPIYAQIMSDNIENNNYYSLRKQVA